MDYHNFILSVRNGNVEETTEYIQSGCDIVLKYDGLCLSDNDSFKHWTRFLRIVNYPKFRYNIVLLNSVCDSGHYDCLKTLIKKRHRLLFLKE